ncbi:T9SS type A sorting domain-containing protein [Flavobacterium plurextorum]|uniref:MBG domain-containing protein n=1 Tax=Flavobacterium TaxID=237 RepID=UPI00214D592D|nr:MULTISPECIES: MBG domain-containing protein [Flavobacterium]UUW08472.1 T9SS type A sorting domain-containing protein [Flavobacterium plurextorum]
MKKNYFLLFLLLFTKLLFAQTSIEAFETESVGSTSFTDNGVIFNIISHSSKFAIANFAGAGWNGTASDNQYIDNTASVGTNASFSIKTTSNLFKTNRFWILLANNSVNLIVSGSLTITGKLNGITKFTQTKTTGFNTSFGTDNGNTLIDLTNLNGQNYSNIVIDELQITTGGAYTYAALDAFTWVKDSGIILPCLTFSGQPSNSRICAGSNTTFSASASDASSYQWQVNTGSGFTNVSNGGPYSGAATQTLIISGAIPEMNGYQYRVVASGSCGPSATSSTAALNVDSAPAITAQPNVSTICTGANTTFSVSASNATAYQWQVDQGAGFTNVSNGAPYSGATTATLTITGATAAMNGYVYRVVATGLCSPAATSSPAPLTFYSAPAITAQPNLSTICTGSNTTFSVSASNAAAYQWQLDQGAGFINVSNSGPYSGATTATLTITGATAAMNGYVYRAVVTGICTPNAVSSNAKLTVNPNPSIITQPTSINGGICAGANTTFSVSASNATAYQWQVDQGAGFNNVSNGAPYSGATTATLTITGATAAMNGYIYRAVATGICSPNATSNAAALYVNSAPAITAQPGNSAICTGTNTTFTVSASNATAYQWQVDQGAGFNNVSNGAPYSGATTATLTITGATTAMNGYIYRAVVTGLCTPNAVSSNAKLTVIPNPSIITQPTSSQGGICAGTNTTYSVSASNVIFYQWQVDTGFGFTDVTNTAPYSGANTSTLTITGTTAEMNGYTYRAVAVGTCNLAAVSNNVILAVNHINVALTKVDVKCYGDLTGQATATATNGTGSYTYSWSPSGGTAATASGLAAGTYTVTVTDGNKCETKESITITQPASGLSATTASTGVSCFGGSNGTASVNVSGGSPGYFYSWAPLGGVTQSISGRPAGDYTCTITDANGCTLVKTVEIKGPAALSGTYTKTDVSCNGGSNGFATVTATGGVGGYKYSWSPTGGSARTASGLAQGTYTVTITDANLCSTTITVTIDQPDLLDATTSQTNVLCNGGATGTATVTASGGKPNSYTYIWSPTGGTAATATGLATGNYSCLITDGNGCFITKTFNITEPAAALSATTSQINATCSTGGQASVSPNGGTLPYSYSWSNGATTQIVTGLAAGNHSAVVTDANGCKITKVFNITTTNTLTAVTSQSNILCNGANTGSASVIPSGAPGPFTYVWAPSGGNNATANKLTAGNYSVTITAANGCSIVKTFTITEPSALVVTPSQTNLICNGAATGSASVDVTGGTGSYTYNWAPAGGTAKTATRLTAGTYTVTITDANLCETTQSFTITEPNPIKITINSKNVSCNGESNGSATAAVIGGTGTYTYAWSPSGGTAATASGLSPGNYSVTVTDANNCTTTESVLITEPNTLTASIGAQIDASCNGSNNGSATVAVSGGFGTYTYSWSPSGGTAATATGLSPGTYTATVTDTNNCTAKQSFTIGEPTALKVTSTQQNVTCYNGNNGEANVTISGGIAPYSYKWSNSDSTTKTAQNLVKGDYVCTITDSNNCSINQNFTITEPAALKVTSTQKNVTCYNGDNGEASVTISGGIAPYSYKWSNSDNTNQTAQNLVKGDYVCTITDSNNCSVNQNFTITQPSNPIGLITSIPTEFTTSSVTLTVNASQNGIDGDLGECTSEIGIVFAAASNPKITDSKIILGSNPGTFTKTVEGLLVNTVYYVRAYAVGKFGYVNYGNEISFTTQKNILKVVAAPDQTKVYGSAEPKLTYVATGFANGDNNSIITGLLSRTAGENTGNYPITIGSLSAGSNYTIDFKTSDFKITKANQVIEWNQELDFGCNTTDQVQLTASSDSGLPVSYEIENSSIANIQGDVLKINRAGTTSIKVSQEGDQNHNPAVQITKLIEVDQSGNISQYWEDTLLFDNSDKNYSAFQWYKNGVLIPGANSQYYSEKPLKGIYSVQAKDKDGNVIKFCPLTIDGQTFSKAIKLYPNPVQSLRELTIESDYSAEELKDSRINIFDLSGKLVTTINNVSPKVIVTAPSSSGIYVVVLSLANGQHKTINLLVR